MISRSVSIPPGKIPDSFGRAVVVFGRSIAAVIMVVLGLFWLGWGFSNVHYLQTFPPVVLVRRSCGSRSTMRLSFFWGLPLAVRRARHQLKSLALVRKISVLAMGSSSGGSRFSKAIGSGIVLLLASQFHRMDLLAAGIGVVVDMHFLPLARLFRFPAYYVTGLAIGFVRCGQHVSLRRKLHHFLRSWNRHRTLDHSHYVLSRSKEIPQM